MDEELATQVCKYQLGVAAHLQLQEEVEKTRSKLDS